MARRSAGAAERTWSGAELVRSAQRLPMAATIPKVGPTVDALLPSGLHPGPRAGDASGSCPSVLVEIDKDPAGCPSQADPADAVSARPAGIVGHRVPRMGAALLRAERLFDLEDLPGAVDEAPVDAEALAALQTAFTASRWAMRTPVEVEVPFEMAIVDTVVRGRIDAVFANPDGTFTVVGLEDRRTARR